MSLNIALAQMTLTLGEPDKNYQKVQDWVGKAADQGADLILLPELWASGFDLKNCQSYAAPLHEGDFARMRSLAEEHKITVGGSLIEQDNDAFYNTFVLYDQSGGMINFYRKIHLFQMLNEKQYFKAGDRLVMAETEWGKIGMATCYDLRFPEMFRAYSVRDTVLILVVAEWAQRRIAHWRQLLQARAVENQCFVAAVNKTGTSQGENLGGYSAVINPMGEYLVQGGEEEELLLAQINLKEVKKTRRWMPVMQDRKPQVYQKFLNE
jgi:predicted amidohydrolase